MKGNGKIFAFALALMLCAFTFGAWLLLVERFQVGDTYPRFSSFRGDPHGAKALYLALGELPGMRVRRNFLALSSLAGESGATIFFFGVDPGDIAQLSAEDRKSLEDLAGRGNRLVIAFASPANPTDRQDAGGKCAERKPAPKDDSKKDTEPENPLSAWHVIMDYFPVRDDVAKKPLLAVRTVEDAGLPDSFKVRSNLCFRPDGGTWRTLYAVDRNPVLLERDFGKGSIVLLSDSRPAGNAALRAERRSGLLLMLLGGNRKAVFDERHLGVSEHPGIMYLIGKYRLTPLLAVIILLAALYVWRNAIPLVPSEGRGRARKSGISTDRDAVGGLVNLLKRNIPSADLLEACVTEWIKSFSREYRESDPVRARIQAVLEQEGAKPSAGRDPAGAYRRIARILAERKKE